MTRSKTTSTFLSQLEEWLDFTEPDDEAYFERSEMTSPYVQAVLGKEYKTSLSVHRQRSQRSCWHTTPFQFQTVLFSLTSAAKLFMCQTWWSSFFFFSFFYTSPSSNALFNVKLSIKLLCSDGKGSHKSWALSFIHLAKFVRYIKTRGLQHD